VQTLLRAHGAGYDAEAAHELGVAFETLRSVGLDAALMIHEEGRHIIFFVNWVSWHRRNIKLWRRPVFELKVLAVWVFLIWERVGIARNIGNGVQDNNFTVTGAKTLGNDIDVAELIDLCLAENTRRMSRYDQRLLRPFAMPALARLARRFMPSKKATTGQTAA